MPDWLPSAKWLSTCGLALDIAGALALAWGAYRMPKDPANPRHDLDEDYADRNTSPVIRDRLELRQAARVGLPLLVVGFLLQLAAMWR